MAHPRTTRLLVLGDGGGSNSATQYLFKEDLQGLANRLGLEIRVAHYPPYCSKHNPIEHRVFPHITRACQGVIFHTVDIARQFIERAKTTTGLRVTWSLCYTTLSPRWLSSTGDMSKEAYDEAGIQSHGQ